MTTKKQMIVKSFRSTAFIFTLLAGSILFFTETGHANQILAGVARVDITDYKATPVNDPLYAKALVLTQGTQTVALITVDAVAIGEIGRIRNNFLDEVRGQIEKELKIPPANVIVNASHCHGVVRTDTATLTIQAVRKACANQVAVRIGAGVGQEDRIMENRRLKLKSGAEADVRRAYPLPPDREVVSSGPVDPDIGLLRIDRSDGKTLAVLYNFACHPIMGVPGGGNTADFPGFASRVIENSMGDGTIALFLQGCAGDINPAMYKEPHRPHNAETLGNLLGLSAVRSLKTIETQEGAELRVIHKTLALPRGTDLEQRITALTAEQSRLLQSLKGTTLNLKTFVPLYVQYSLASNYPSYYSYRYLQDQEDGRSDLAKLDTDNRSAMARYIHNIYTMEELIRVKENLRLLKMHHAQNIAADHKPIDAEITVLKVGDFILATFPGEPSVEIGLNIKRQSPHPLTFVAGYCNGYLYYAPTVKQRNNSGFAQEDCDCVLAPEWQNLYEEKILKLLKSL